MRTALVICSDANTFESLAHLFAPGRWEVEQAVRLDEAIRLVALEPPDLVIIHPSGGDGWAALDRMRRATGMDGVPIVSLLSDARRHEADRKLPDAPAPACLVPLGDGEGPLRSAIEELLQNRPARGARRDELSLPELEAQLEAFLEREDDDEESELEVEIIELAAGESLAAHDDGLAPVAVTAILPGTPTVDLPSGAPIDAAPPFVAPAPPLPEGPPSQLPKTPPPFTPPPPPLSGEEFQLPPLPVESEELETSAGELDDDVERDPARLELARGEPLIKFLSRALVTWEGELRKVTAQRDKTREAFTKVRDRAKSLAAEREQTAEKIKRVGKEMIRLRARVAELEAAEADAEERVAAEQTTAELSVAETQEFAAADITSPPPSVEEGGSSTTGGRDTASSAPPAASGAHQTELAEAREEIAELRDEADRAWSECDILTVRLGEAEEALETARADAARISGDSEELHRRLAQHERGEKEALARLEVVRDEAAELRESLESLREEARSHDEDFTRLEEELQRVRSALATVEADLTPTRQALEEATVERDMARQKAEHAIAELEETRRELGDRTTTAAESRERAETLSRELETAQDEANRWEGKASRLKASLDVAEAGARSWHEEREQLLGQLERARTTERSERSVPAEKERPEPAVVDLVELPVEIALGPDDEKTSPLALVAYEAKISELTSERDSYRKEMKRAQRREQKLMRKLLLVETDLAELQRTGGAPYAAAPGPQPSVPPPSPSPDLTAAAIAAATEELETQLDEQRQKSDLLGRELAATQRELETCRERASVQLDENRLRSALATTEAELATISGVRTSGSERRKSWQALMTRIGVQLSSVMKVAAELAPVRETGVNIESLFQDLKRLAGESAALFKERREFVDHHESTLRTLRDRLRGAGVAGHLSQQADRLPPPGPVSPISAPNSQPISFALNGSDAPEGSSSPHED